MSLRDWLGLPAPESVKRIQPRSLSPLLRQPTAPERTVLGVLGTRSNVRYEEFERDVLAPLVEAWGVPDELMLPAESDSTQMILTWAKQKDIPVRLVTAEWKQQGSRAGALRDGLIQRDSTHLLLLQGPRSNALMTLGKRLERKGRPVVISERPGEPVKAPNQQTETEI
jgi:hypothetical protein